MANSSPLRAEAEVCRVIIFFSDPDLFERLSITLVLYTIIKALIEHRITAKDIPYLSKCPLNGCFVGEAIENENDSSFRSLKINVTLVYEVLSRYSSKRITDLSFGVLILVHIIRVSVLGTIM